MGVCASSGAKKSVANPAVKESSPPPSKVEVLGLPVSQNTMGPVLLAMDCGKGGLEMCDIMKGEQMKPEFLAMNPFHHIPTMKDGGVSIGESTAILRYIAMRYKPEYYPVDDPVACGKIDFALDSFTAEVYEKGHYHTVYVVLGFTSAPVDQKAANDKYSELLDAWLKHFLQGKFVNGDKLSIADFKAVPFLIAGLQPAVESTIGLTLPDRARQYVEDFCAAVPSSGMLKSAGGYSIVEFLASKAPDAKAAVNSYTKVEYIMEPTPEPSGDVKIFGLPVSQNTMGPVLLAMDCGKGGLEMCDIMKGEQMKPEFLAMNPFHHIPTMKDGGVSIGESTAILRYIAMKYKPEYYPVDDPVACGKIDFALDSFTTEVYEKGHYHTVYVVLGFTSAPADQKAANDKYSELLDAWLKHFLQGKFVNGDKLSIADFKAVPFLIAGLQPAVESTIGLKLPDRAKQYVEDFCAAVPSSGMLKSAGGYSIVEFLASKMPAVVWRCATS
ncbi:unnamed protein product [Prorocentrum cordatum]|uniref:Glutathione transferase n=2 Tax=Prorocentrum cordatum TaxID=2364126 RepID=A0ABN9U2V6_9DINO|nr:unnamed protein product [Polarella glacialis]